MSSFVKFEWNWSFKISAFLSLLLCRNPSLLIKGGTPLASCRLLLMADKTAWGFLLNLY